MEGLWSQASLKAERKGPWGERDWLIHTKRSWRGKAEIGISGKIVHGKEHNFLFQIWD